MSANNPQRRHVRILLAVAAGMFGFAFALVPLYETFCELTGLNGRTPGRPSDKTTRQGQQLRRKTLSELTAGGERKGAQ